MAKSQPKITLSESRDIPFNKLVLSQSNVRRVKAGVAIEELAEDIARRTLLQSLTVRPVLDETGAETGMYEVPAGGRRYRALELLVKQKRLSRTAPVPCIVRTGGIAEEDSLAENVQRAPLHPLDQFRAFLALREKGQSEEEIAAAFFVSVTVVRQRLRLAAVSPKLLDVYAEDGMSLDQLMAFTVNPDHARQEQVWEALQRVPVRQTYQIRRMLTEDTVRASDRRARFVGIADYEAAGGSSCATCSSPTTAAGCRTLPCSTGSSPRSWSGKRKASAPRDGSGSRSRPTSPMVTRTGCAGSAGRRCR
jgi:ParB family transcriptional regulator, chromosome partitioning protein